MSADVQAVKPGEVGFERQRVDGDAEATGAAKPPEAGAGSGGSAEADGGGGPASATATEKRRQSRLETRRVAGKPRLLPLYHVILLNDDDHTYEYVIDMLAELFAYPAERGYKLAKEVDTQGRAIVLTTHKEHAELKRDQIHAYGSDVRVMRSKGSMRAVIEPAE